MSIKNKCKSENVINKAMESSQNNDSMSYIGFKQRPFQITIITDYTSTKHLFQTQQEEACQQHITCRLVMRLYEKDKKYKVKLKQLDKLNANLNQISFAHYAT